MNLPEITDLRRLNLQPGDRLVLRVKGRIPADQAQELLACTRAWAGDEVPVMILDDDASLEIVSGDAREIAR